MHYISDFVMNLPVWPFTILAALLGILGVLYAQKLNSFRNASINFRSKILAELEGIYPVVHTWWEENRLPQFLLSLPKVETAAAEFRHFVKRKTEFDAAVKAYREYCQKRIYDRAMAWSCYQDAHKSGDIGPAEEFKNIVERLFSFTK